MRLRLLVPCLLALIPTCTPALEFSGTCRGASATIVKLEGLDTSRARATAQYTLPDAISYCHYSLGRAASKRNPSPAATSACATRFLQQSAASGQVYAEANCQIGTLSTGAGNWSNAFQMPLARICGGDNLQAIALFKTLCPGYDGPIEKDP